MKKIVNTWFNEKLAKQSFFTGLIYELEDGTYFVTAHDGYVQPGAIYTKEQFQDAESKS